VSATLTVVLPRPQPSPPPVGRLPRIVRLLALAHDIERRVRSGELDDFAAAARAYGLTRARVTQIVNLTLLAPTLQEEILAMGPVVEGRDTITERGLRAVVAEPTWSNQLRHWHGLLDGPRVTRRGGDFDHAEPVGATAIAAPREEGRAQERDDRQSDHC
jgi:hypothetical protein